MTLTLSKTQQAQNLLNSRHLPNQDDLAARDEFAAACSQAAKEDATTFHFCYNPDIVRVPDEVSRLKNTLQVLHIDNCFNLTELPASIGELRALRWLNVQYNKLKSLPSQIGKLSRLERLHCGNNALEQLPLELGALTELEELQCGNNKLKTLVSPVLQLPKLRELHVENNPFISKADVEGIDPYLVIPPRLEFGSTICSLTRLRMQADQRPVTFVSFHTFLGQTGLPIVHYVVDDKCKEQLKRKLLETFGNNVEIVADPPAE
jgi:hypothetical protein